MAGMSDELCFIQIYSGVQMARLFLIMSILQSSGSYLFIRVGARIVAIIASSRGDHLLIFGHLWLPPPSCSVPNSSDRLIFVKRRAFFSKNTGVRRAKRRAKLKFL